MSGGWDDAFVAQQYRAFERRHSRYRRANAALAEQAALTPDLRVLDLAAGTGGTTAALLPSLGPRARVDCIEPAAAMAAAGRLRVGQDPRVHWWRSLRELEAAARFDRIVCGAAIWLWPDVPVLLGRLARRLAPGGALVFDIPAAYLGEPDGPGGGHDPYLTDLLAAALQRHPAATRAAGAGALLSAADIEAALGAAGLVPQPWEHHQRLTQAAWRDWLCLPVLTAQLWPAVPAAERADRIRAAAAEADAGSWRRERWRGWTAWKPAFETRALPDATSLLATPAALRQRARRDGALLLRGLLPAPALRRLQRRVSAAARELGLLDRHGRWCGVAAAAPHEIPRWITLQQQVALTAEFQSLVEAPALRETVATITGCAVRSGLGTVCRIAPPEHLVPATPPHRDAQFLRQSAGVWSAWIPLLGCAVHEGGLAVAPGSQRGTAATRWAAADMAVGDVLLVSAQTLHRSVPNRRLHLPRLSVDLRFGPA